MQIREIDGVEHTNRAGAAEILHRSRGSVDKLAGAPGFPRGRRIGRSDWYPVPALHAYGRQLDGHRQLPPVPDGDPDELLNSDAAAKALAITRATLDRYVADSVAPWARSEHGVLCAPDQSEPGRNGISRRWKRSTLARCQSEHRPGRGGLGAGRPPASATRSDIMPRAATLTARQQQIVNFVAAGMTNAAIARQLGMAEGTVKAHLNRVFRAYGVRTRDELVRIIRI
jgi:DNA-binding NarL/FixJ family response regulator